MGQSLPPLCVWFVAARSARVQPSAQHNGSTDAIALIIMMRASTTAFMHVEYKPGSVRAYLTTTD